MPRHLQHDMHTSPVSPRWRAFTLVEMMVVVAIIGLLMGILLPTLAAARKKSAKTAEMNNIRQLLVAWNSYANFSNDAAIPGYLHADVQKKWKVKYDYPTAPVGLVDKTIPPAPSYIASDPNIAGPWTWRLAPYLDYSHEVLFGYADEDDDSVFRLIAKAQQVAEQPAFGYNGYYIGGYWRMHNVGGQDRPMPEFYNHCITATGTRLLIPTTISQIKRSNEMVVFCAGGTFDPAIQTTVHATKLERTFPGSFLVTPPTTSTPMWRPDLQDPVNMIQILSSSPVMAPLPRYTTTISVLWADGHTDGQSYNALADQRHWIDNAEAKDYQHAPCP